MNIKSGDKINDKIENSVNNNLQQLRQRFEKFKNLLFDEMRDKETKFEEFDTYYNKTVKNTQQLISLIQGVLNASREQQTGIEQTKYIVIETQYLANSIVNAANEK